MTRRRYHVPLIPEKHGVRRILGISVVVWLSYNRLDEIGFAHVR